MCVSYENCSASTRYFYTLLSHVPSLFFFDWTVMLSKHYRNTYQVYYRPILFNFFLKCVFVRSNNNTIYHDILHYEHYVYNIKREILPRKITNLACHKVFSSPCLQSAEHRAHNLFSFLSLFHYYLFSSEKEKIIEHAPEKGWCWLK